MKVISFKICPFVQRVTALLEAKGLAYEIEFISLKNKPAWFLELSPNGQVPILVTDKGKALFESEAIVEYIEEAYPALQPTLQPEDKAINRAWGYLAAKHYLVQCSAQRSADLATLKERSDKLEQAFEKIEKQLDNAAYFGGDTLGLVDIAWLPLLHRANIIHQKTGYDFIGDRPKVKRWQAALMETGLAEKSVAPDFDDAFADFYLSSETFLGRGGDVESLSTQKSCRVRSCC